MCDVDGWMGGVVHVGDWTDVDVVQVEHLDLSKAKATDLLRAHDANAEKAMMAWVSASV